MATMTIRLPDEKHERLKHLAHQRGLSLNELIEEWSTVALTEFGAEAHFRLLAAEGDAKKARTERERGRTIAYFSRSPACPPHRPF